jgi:ketosteroid isomerase-like protein
MTMSVEARDATATVSATAAALVDAFGRHDKSAYFAFFAPDASFIFHTTDVIVRSRREYELLCDSWEADGFHVLSCQSIDPDVHLLTGDIAVFTHRVRTEVRFGGDPELLGERESILFHRSEAGSWLAVHEHLSPDPLWNQETT